MISIIFHIIRKYKNIVNINVIKVIKIIEQNIANKSLKGGKVIC